MVTRYELNCNDEETKNSIMKSLKDLRFSTGETNGAIINTALNLLTKCENLDVVLVKDAIKALQELKERV